MAYAALPLTGAGDATAKVATDLIGDEHFQRMKIFSGEEGSTVPLIAKATTPGSTDPGLVVRPIPSSGLVQLVGGSVALTSEGSSRLIGRVDINNPTTEVSIAGAVAISNPSTAVTITNPSTAVTITNPTTAVNVANPTTAVSVSSGVILGGGSSANTIGNVTVSNLSTGGGGSTTVDANLTSAGSTKVVGIVNVSSGVVLGNGSSANILGGVALLNGTSANTIGNVTVSNLSTGGGGSTTVDANLSSAGSTRLVGIVNVSSGVILGAGSTSNAIGSVALLAGTSANTLGNVTVSNLSTGGGGSTTVNAIQSSGSSANYWFMQGIPYSSANIARTTINTSADASVIAANANRKALSIANLSSAQIVGLGLSTAAVSTARANVSILLQPNSQLTFGLGGDYPLFTGPIRGVNLSSTAVAGGVCALEFS